jgi:Asp-tRNA(Asn)/Glu-tRNA(Gln) amidotransferase A subunit family amidase
MLHDLSAAREALRDGQARADELLEQSLAAADAEACRHAFIRRFDASARATADGATLLARAGAPLPPLAGLAVSVKDLFDVAGAPTTAGSRVLEDASPALADAPAVARLRAAGAALVGQTNMTEFAFSGLGLNPHHGTPLNPVTRQIDGLERIPGGSSSGAAVSVAAGAAWAALGSDTGGSIRIPAALTGLVGFKNTARLTPIEGTIPLSTSLDTACAITRSVRDAILLHEILANRPVSLRHRPLSARRFAVVAPVFQDGMDDTVAASFTRTLQALSKAGAQIETIDLPPLRTLPPSGIVVAAEAWAWHRSLMFGRADGYDPRVAQRILPGKDVLAADYIERVQARQRWIAEMGAQLAGFDAVLSPTVPVVAPLLAPLVESDAAYFAANNLLLRNTAVVNALDGCALSLPCHARGELPVGLMLWSTALTDDTILDIALQIEQTLAETLA